jgi:hypothetical protein
VGPAVVFAIARDQARARRLETNLLKVLGADFRLVRAALDLSTARSGSLPRSPARRSARWRAPARAPRARGALDAAAAPLVGAALGVPWRASSRRGWPRRELRERPWRCCSSFVRES